MSEPLWKTPDSLRVGVRAVAFGGEALVGKCGERGSGFVVKVGHVPRLYLGHWEKHVPLSDWALPRTEVRREG